MDIDSRSLLIIMCTALALFGCGGGAGGTDPNACPETVVGCNTTASGAGGSTSTGGSGGTAGSGGGATGGTGSASSSDLALGSPDVESLVKALECQRIEPLANEDGAFVRKVFIAPVDGHVLTASFYAVDDATTASPNPWTVGVGVVPAGTTPDSVSCASVSVAQQLTAGLVQNVGPGATATRWEWHPTALFKTGDALLVCVQEHTAAGSGTGKATGVLQCGKPGTGTDTDQWQEPDNSLSKMCSYGASYCRDWSTTLLVKKD